MFILGLRGQRGIKLILEFHYLILASGVLLYLFSNTFLEISICIVFFALYLRTIKRMINYRDELKFSTNIASKLLFPEDRKSAKIVFLFHLFLSSFLFPLLIAILFSDLAPEGQTQAMSWIFFYYFGNLALIGMLTVKVQKYAE